MLLTKFDYFLKYFYKLSITIYLLF